MVKLEGNISVCLSTLSGSRQKPSELLIALGNRWSKQKIKDNQPATSDSTMQIHFFAFVFMEKN
jgi:hypothetical protein